MAESTTITVRIGKDVKERLDALAESTRRSKSYLAAEAIAQYVDTNAWQVAQIKDAIREADAGGPFISHEEVKRWALSLGTPHELPRPKGTKRS
jgi:predicted transcriptional regulator